MLGDLTVKIGADIKELQSKLRSATGSIRSAGKKMSEVGRGLSLRVTAPLVLMGGAALKSAADFEASMTKIETLVGLAANQVDGMKASVIALSRETGVAATELSDALFTVTSAGARGANAMKILEAASKASAAGLGNTRSIAQAVTASMQAYGEENLSAARATDIFTSIVREGNLEAESLAPTLGRVIGIASQAGVSFEEVGASLATFTRLGVNAEEATSALRGVISTIISPTAQSKQALAELGLESGALQRMVGEKGLAQTLQFLVTSFEGNTEALTQIIPNVRALSAVLGTAGAQGEQYAQIVDNITNSQGILDEAFKTTAEDPLFKFNKELNALKTDSLELGRSLLPLATKGLEMFGDIMDKVRGISSETRGAIAAVSIALAAIGPTVWAIGAAIAALTSPITLVIAAIAGLAAGILYLSDNWAAVKERISDISWWRNTLLDMAALAIEYSFPSLLIKGLNEVIEIFKDINWFKDVLLRMGKLVLKYNPISLLIKGINTVLEYLNRDLIEPIKGFNEDIMGGGAIPNPYEGMANGLRALKVETGEYQHQFGSFTDAVLNGFNAITGIDFGGIFSGFEDATEDATEIQDDFAESTGNATQKLIEQITWFKALDATVSMSFNKFRKMLAEFSVSFVNALGVVADEALSAFTNALFMARQFNTQELELRKISLQKQLTALRQSLNAQEISQKEYALRVALINKELLDTEIQINKARENSFKRSMTALVQATKKAVRKMLAEFAKLAIIKGIGALFGLSGVGSSVDLFKGLGKKIGLPGFAKGGFPEVGKLSIVGEQGPELFVPSTNGAILPNNFMAGGGTQNVNVTVTGRLDGKDIYVSGERGGIDWNR